MSSALISLAATACHAVMFVAAIHVFDRGSLRRDSMTSIIRRFTGAMVATCLAAISTLRLLPVSRCRNLTDCAFHLGLSLDSLATLLLPVLLTVLLFIGPLATSYVYGYFTRSSLRRCCAELRNPSFLRTAILSPVVEELAFRACSCSLLVAYFSPTTVMFVAPLWFSLAHFHHIYRLVKVEDYDFGEAFFTCSFQACFTYVFGVYASFIYLRLGSVYPCILSHSFCNVMGFPDFTAVARLQNRYTKLHLSLAYVFGLGLWLALLGPLTDPRLYYSRQETLVYVGEVDTPKYAEAVAAGLYHYRFTTL